ncbi:MAG: FHA domain-containing protein [Thermoguttaceae bacterium]|jgi:pSer/pThr/pTyr-binding forkhead associated (FHA) protein
MEVKLVVIGGKNQGREIPVTEPEFLIGRSEDCHLRPASDRVSRKHCAIRLQEGRATVVDFKSTNHTFVNGEQVTTERELKNGDRLKVGVLEFEVQLAVSVGGKIKPKVHTIQEAAARTVQTTAAKEDELDITRWLEDGEAEPAEQPRSSETLSIKDTHTTGHKMADTTTIHMLHKEAEEGPKKEEKPPPKTPGQFKRPKKPVSQDSKSAADDMLKQFFNRKKP